MSNHALHLQEARLMPLWDVQLPKWTGQNFVQVEPLDVLVETDEPLTFTFKDVSGSLMLAHLASHGPNRLRYIVVPTTDLIIEQLKSGARSIQGSLDQPIVWLLDLGEYAKVTDAWVTTLADLPPRVVPAPEVMLYASLEPLIRLRAIGSQIEPGAIPARVIKNLVAGAETAWRRLTNWVTERKGTGRIPNEDRVLYELVARRLRFASFEVSFDPANADDGKLTHDIAAESVVSKVSDMMSRPVILHRESDRH